MDIEEEIDKAEVEMKDELKGTRTFSGEQLKKYDYGLLAIRLGLAVFIMHGFAKLTGLEGTAAFFGNIGIPLAGIMAIVVGLVEFFGGFAILLGIATRISGALLAAVMVVAILLVKLPNGWPAFELDLVLLLMAVSMLFLGPGRLSVKEILCKKDKNNMLCKL